MVSVAPEQLAEPPVIDLASALRPALLLLTRLIRNQSADLSMTLTQVSALVILEKAGPMCAGRLAAHERVQPPSMTKVIASLEEAGYVRREVDPADRRHSIIAITAQGRALLDQERSSRDAWLAARLAALTTAERQQVQAAIPVLVKLAEQ